VLKATEARKRGGNRKPKTFRICECCGLTFGPLDRLSRRFCSANCKVQAQKTGRRVKRKTIAIAKNAQSLLRYHVQAGNVIRPM